MWISVNLCVRKYKYTNIVDVNLNSSMTPMNLRTFHMLYRRLLGKSLVNESIMKLIINY